MILHEIRGTTRAPAVGICIYCGAREGLSDEHIIRHRLGGNLVLPDGWSARPDRASFCYLLVLASFACWNPVMTSPQGSAATVPPKIHEATLAIGPSRAVLKGLEIDFATAVSRRQAEQDVVVCGEEVSANRRLAQAIESAVGPASRPQTPHTRAGPWALPHFHQQSRSPAGHTFYETENPRRKASKNP